jgi:hypothetical protein
MTIDLSYLQATRRLHRSASDVLATLQVDGPTLVAEATVRAVAEVEPLLVEGRFRRPAAPRVHTEHDPSGPAALRITWNRNDADRWPPSTSFAMRATSRWWRTDEEETGWPTVEIDLIVEPREQGSQLGAVSSRPPGTDVSTNRIDRHLRDRIARAALEEFLIALAVNVDERVGSGSQAEA